MTRSTKKRKATSKKKEAPRATAPVRESKRKRAEKAAPPRKKPPPPSAAAQAPQNAKSRAKDIESSLVATTKNPPALQEKSLVWIKNRLPPQCDDYFFPPVFHLPKISTPSRRYPPLRIFPERSTDTRIHFRSDAPLPELSSSETLLWRHKYAANACVNRADFPFGVYRLLGTITRTGVVLVEKKRSVNYLNRLCGYPAVPERRAKKISSGTAQNLARNEVENGLLEEKKISSRATQIQNQWIEILAKDMYSGGSLTDCPWDPIGRIDFHDEDHMDTKELLDRLSVNDESDLQEILESCEDLRNPRHLWKIPLLLAYPVVTSEKTKNRKQHKVHMAIYMHRLLPEATTTSLRVILEALDDESYLCTRSCANIPQQPVFASDPYPQVITDEEEILKMEKEHDDEEGSKGDTGKISAFSTEGLLKLMEHTGTDITDYNKRYSRRVNTHLQLSLLPYQVHGIAWMIQMEALESINDLFWEEREFWDGGKYYCCQELGQIRLDRPAMLKGGLLCDMMGLGKTIEILGLIVATLPDMKKEAKETGRSHATLIIVPPALVAQWISEIRKCVGDNLLTVDYFDFRTSALERRLGEDEKDADIVVTTYSALEKPATAKFLQNELWGRIVLDEMQEIRSSTTVIAKMCEKLSGDRRWMLSGTPFFEGIGDLRGELNFLKLCPFAASNEDGFFKFMISDPFDDRVIEAVERLELLSAIMLRRSKNMSVIETGRPLLDRLPPLTVEFVPVQQNDSERALYYFMESIAGYEAALKDTPNNHKRLCLRLLRELCLSPILLTGGIGVNSQLKDLNALLISQGRRKKANPLATNAINASRDYSCDEAILHLAELTQAARSGQGEVSELALGFGQGLSRRVRAVDVEKLAEIEAAFRKAETDIAESRRQRARLRWYWALEKITTAQIHVPPSKCRSLWLWRSAFLKAPKAPRIFCRGWRASERLLHRLPFPWAKQSSVLLEGIPLEIKAEKVLAAIDSAVSLGASNVGPSCELVERSRHESSWSAYLVLPNKDSKARITAQAAKGKGVVLDKDPESVVVKAAVEKAKEAYDKATATSNIRPTDKNVELRKAAKRHLSSIKSGMYITNAEGSGHVSVGPACGPPRVNVDSASVRMEDAALAEIVQHTKVISAASKTIQSHESRMERINKPANGLSAIESLQALGNGDQEKTSCCICLQYLGSTIEESGTIDAANISLTKCGHLYCRKCLRDYVNQGLAIMNCPSCRKPFAYATDVVHVDPTLKDDDVKDGEFEGLVEEALRLLSKKDGRLPPDMWRHLFKSIGLPNVSHARDARASAIPGNFLAHLRSFGPLFSKKVEVPDSLTGEPSFLSSKVKAVLRDLPTEERSIVFSTSKATIEHLASVLTISGIVYRSLFSGQKVDDTEQAIVEWQSTSPTGTIEVPVLLVQAGAAASGITLTAASKMFLMEPFPRLSEEQQAFGQEHPVHAKVYYSPISVESRLLEWRKRSTASGGKNTSNAQDTANVVYASLDSDDDSDGDDGTEEDEEEQVHFILGTQGP